MCGVAQVKVKGKPSNDRPPYFDFSVLRLKSLRMILLSSGIGAIGAYTPLFYLVSDVNYKQSFARQTTLFKRVVFEATTNNNNNKNDDK